MLITSDSTRRALRTVVHGALALAASAAVLSTAFPQANEVEQIAAVLVALAMVSKAYNALEDAGVLPSWLKHLGPAAADQSTTDGRRPA